MRRKMLASLSVVLLMVLGLTTAAVLPSGAQTPAPITLEELTPRSEFTDDLTIRTRYMFDGMARSRLVKVNDPARTVVARITVQPGAQFPWHIHSGPVFVNVAAGELVYVRAKDCVERSYPMGTAFLDAGNTVHTAYNPTEDVTVIVATFYKVAETGPLSITEGVVAPDDCSVEGGPHSH